MTAAMLQPVANEPLETDDPFLAWPDGSLRGMFEADPPRVEWLATNRLLVGRAHALVGVGGSSKTRALYHMGLGAVIGSVPWDWTLERTGSAALFLTEDTVSDVHRTIHRLGAELSADQRREIVRMLRVYALAGKYARLLSLIEGGRLVESDAYDWVMRQVERMPKPVTFLGFDPALALTEGDEMNQAHQRRLGELMDRIAIETGACVMLSAHAAKGLIHAEELGSHSARGGGALTDAVRAEYTLRTMTADEARRFGINDRAERESYVQLQATKGNHLPPEAFAPVWLRRGHGGALSGVTLEQVERGSVGPKELKALELLRAAHVNGQSTLKFWRQECEASGLFPPTANEAAREKAMQRVKDALVSAGMVSKGDQRGLWIPT